MDEIEAIEADVRRRLGDLPAWLKCAQSRPGAMRALWAQMRECCLDNPLPAVLKQRILLRLAWLSGAAYAVAFHAVALRQETAAGVQALRLLRRPCATEAEVHSAMRRLSAGRRPMPRLPDPETAAESALLSVVEALWGQRCGDEPAETLQAVLGAPAYADVLSLLGFARSMQTWLAASPGLGIEDDPSLRRKLEQLFAEEPELRQAFAQATPPAARAPAGALRTRSSLIHAPLPVMVYAEDGQVLQLNDVWTELTGYTVEDVPTLADWRRKAQPEMTATTPDDIDALYETDQRVDEGEQSLYSAEGRQLIWDFSSAPLGRLDDGRRAVLRMAVDVSGRRHLEEALWAANKRMVGILESITDGFFALDRQWRFVYVNERAEQIVRRSRQALAGKIIWAEFPDAEALGLTTRAQQVVASGQTLDLEIEYPRTGRWFEVHLYPSDDGLAVYFRDITQRVTLQRALEQTEARNRALLAAVPDLMFRVAQDGTHLDYVAVHPEEMLLRPEQFLGRKIAEVLPAEAGVPLAQAIDAAFRTGQVQTVEYPLTIRGQVRFFEARTAPCGGGEAMVIIRNISDRRRAEESLHEATQALRAVIEASPHATLLVELDGRVRSWNPAAERIYGWTPAEVAGKPLLAILADNHAQFEQHLARLRQGKPLGNLVMPLLRKGGSALPTRLSIAPISTSSGKVSCLIAVLSHADGPPHLPMMPGG